MGYRYYDSKQIPVRWAFGHGLSYTGFAYSNLRLSAAEMNDETAVTVSVDVTNTGDMAGKEVVQLYVSDCNGTAGRPAKELKGFGKIALEPGQTGTVSMTLTARDLSFWHEELGDWYAPSGSYAVQVGHASDDIRLTAQVAFTTSKLLPLVVEPATTIGELMADPRTAPMIQEMMANMGGGMLDLNDPSMKTMLEAMLKGMPIKSLMSFGMITHEQAEGLIAALNAAVNG